MEHTEYKRANPQCKLSISQLMICNAALVPMVILGSSHKTELNSNLFIMYNETDKYQDFNKIRRKLKTY